MSFAYVNGIKLFYEQEGKGADLILIGGLSAHHGAWKYIGSTLATKFRTLKFDNRGAGQSDVPTFPYSIEDMAKDTICLMDNLGIKQAYILGHSMGGNILQQILLDYPTRVLKAIICSSSLVMPIQTIMCLQIKSKLLEENLKQELILETLLPWAFGSEYLSDKNRVQSTINAMLNDPYAQSKAGFDGQVKAIANIDFREKLYSVNTETMVIAGQEDLIMPAKYSEHIHHQIKSSSFKIIDDVGHMLHIECPDKLINLVTDFII